MTPSSVRGYAARAMGNPLELITYDPPELGEQDIRVSVTHCGVCHTDIQAIDDYYGITPFPFVPGHEIVGNVSELGPSVTSLKVGDRIGVGWQGRSCGTCEWCLKGEPQLCMEIGNMGVWERRGGFSSSIIVDHRFAYPLPPAMPSPVAAVLMCAGISSYSALRRYVTNPEMKVAILGIGGLGHLAIQFAHALGCEVTAISSSPEKEAQALAFGADRFIDSNDKNAMRQVDYHFDLVMCTANGGIYWGRTTTSLKKRGRLVLIGFPDLKLNSTDLVAHELSITGSFIGNGAIMREMLAFAREHKIEPVIELMPMSKVNEALQRVKENKARYRVVLMNDMSSVRDG
jgi:uncharacterized zinc-type alcohol dehydrogenase-like protein